MPEFILAYHGGKHPETPEAGAKHMADWKGWVASLGEAMVNPGSPLGKSKTVSDDSCEDGGGLNPINGFSIVNASDMDAAVAVAQSCPFLAIGGTIEVAEIMQMKM